MACHYLNSSAPGDMCQLRYQTELISSSFTVLTIFCLSFSAGYGETPLYRLNETKIYQKKSIKCPFPMWFDIIAGVCCQFNYLPSSSQGFYALQTPNWQPCSCIFFPQTPGSWQPCDKDQRQSHRKAWSSSWNFFEIRLFRNENFLGGLRNLEWKWICWNDGCKLFDLS